MGNCQAAEAAAVVIEHPNHNLERIYSSVTANQVMTANPGHLVALVITSPLIKSGNATPIKQLKLLRPGDTLLIGRLYRLITFQDVVNEFAAKKCVKLGKLLKERGMESAITMRMNTNESASVSINPSPNPDPKFRPKPPRGACNNNNKAEQKVCKMGKNGGRRSNNSRGGVRQWKPALQSIAEVGT